MNVVRFSCHSKKKARIITRNFSTIAVTSISWQNCQPTRNYLTRTLDETNYYKISCNLKEDSLMIWKIVEDIFSSLTANIKDQDKRALLLNFLPRWSVLTSAIDKERNKERYSTVNSIEAFEEIINAFYTFEEPEKSGLTPEKMLQTFGPLLVYYGKKVIDPIYEKGLDRIEYMALALIIFFDGAYSNLSAECSKLCQTIQNLMFRELKNYQTDNNLDEIRFAEAIDILNIVERGEKKFYEELLICDMHNVILHEEYRILLNERNG